MSAGSPHPLFHFSVMSKKEYVSERICDGSPRQSHSSAEVKLCGREPTGHYLALIPELEIKMRNSSFRGLFKTPLMWNCSSCKWGVLSCASRGSLGSRCWGREGVGKVSGGVEAVRTKGKEAGVGTGAIHPRQAWGRRSTAWRKGLGLPTACLAQGCGLPGTAWDLGGSVRTVS